MKKNIIYLAATFCVIILSIGSIFGQNTTVSLTVNMDECDEEELDSYHCKVTLKQFSGEDCTGTETYCYRIDYWNPTYTPSPVSYTWPSCSTSTGTYIEVYVGLYNDDGGALVCDGLSACIRYEKDVAVSVSIGP